MGRAIKVLIPTSLESYHHTPGIYPTEASFGISGTTQHSLTKRSQSNKTADGWFVWCAFQRTVQEEKTPLINFGQPINYKRNTKDLLLLVRQLCNQWESNFYQNILDIFMSIATALIQTCIPSYLYDRIYYFKYSMLGPVLSDCMCVCVHICVSIYPYIHRCI